MSADTSREAVERLACSMERLSSIYDTPSERRAIHRSNEAAGTLRALLAERDAAVADERAHSAAVNRLEAERDAARSDAARLREALDDAIEALDDAIECVEAWAAYASEYFKGKHDLAGDLARLRAALAGSTPA